MTLAIYHGIHGIIVVFDITDKKTFDDVKSWVNDVYRICERNVPILLIGNKTNLEHMSAISKNEGEQLAREINGVYIETSAFNGNHIDDAFAIIINACINRYNVKIYEARTYTSNRTKRTFKQDPKYANLHIPPTLNEKWAGNANNLDSKKESKCCS